MIRDSRLLKDLNYKHSVDIKRVNYTALDKAVQDEKIEELQWTFQLYFSGIIESLLWRILHFSCKQICIHNPKLPCFYIIGFKMEKNHNTKFQKDDILLLRNHRIKKYYC